LLFKNDGGEDDDDNDDDDDDDAFLSLSFIYEESRALSISLLVEGQCLPQRTGPCI
jgi:hypothetical protein